MPTSQVQKMLSQLSQNKNVKNLISEFNKISADLKKFDQNKMKTEVTEKTEKAMHDAKAKYDQVLKQVKESQALLDNEASKALKKIKKSILDVEKNLESYKKKALVQKTKIEKALTQKIHGKKTVTQKAKAGVKTSMKKTSKAAGKVAATAKAKGTAARKSVRKVVKG